MATPKRINFVAPDRKGNVLLSIVPEDSFEEPEDAPPPPSRWPDPAPLHLGPVAVHAEPEAAPEPSEEIELELDFLEDPEVPAPTMDPAPIRVEGPPRAPAAAPQKPRRTGLLVAGALGGGMFLGGGAVGLILVLLAVLGGVGAGAWWLWSSIPETPVVEATQPEIVPVVPVDVDVDDAVADADDAVADTDGGEADAPADDAAPAPAPRRSAPAPAPTAGPAPATPAPTPAAPPAPAPADELALGDTVTVKILTDPPAALLWVDGQDAGRSPAKLTLEPGSYQLTVESGKARGTFPIDAGLDSDRYCFEAKGKKLSLVGCQ